MNKKEKERIRRIINFLHRSNLLCIREGAMLPLYPSEQIIDLCKYFLGEPQDKWDDSMK